MAWVRLKDGAFELRELHRVISSKLLGYNYIFRSQFVTTQPLGEPEVLRGTASYPTFDRMNVNQYIPPARVAKLRRLLASRSKKTKISISVSADLLAAADELAGKSRRSELFERGVRSLVRAVVRRARHERELTLLNQHAESLNAAAADTLEFQSDVDE